MLVRSILLGALVGMNAVVATPSTGFAAPPPERPLYVTHGVSDDVAGFTIGRDRRPVAGGGLVAAAGEPASIVFAPDGGTAFVALRDAGKVAAYTVGGRGRLSPLGEPVDTGGGLAFGMAIAPDGRTLYTSNIDTGTVSAFTVGGDGTLRLMGTPVPAGASARSLAVSVDGRFLYVGHGRPLTTPTDVITRLAIGPSGKPRPVGEPVETGGSISELVTSPDGRFLYATNTTTDKVSGFRIGANGDLTAVPGSPFDGPDHAEGAAMAPDGRQLFVTGPGQVRPDTGRGSVAAYTVDGDGSLTPGPNSPVKAGRGPVGIATSPDGRRLYVAGFEFNTLSTFEVSHNAQVRELSGSPHPSGGTAPGFESIGIPPNQGPIASFTTTPTGQTINLDGSHSTDPDGNIAHYDWNFSDGTRQRTTTPTTRHTYRSTGTFTVTLTATDNEGCTTTRVYTGHHAPCEGSAAARTTRTVEVRL